MPEATNSVQLDRRGNVIRRVDAGSNVFTTAFDGLDRAKVTAGPAIVTVIRPEWHPPSGPITYVTNVLQQVVTNFYDAAGRVLTNVNALGEQTVTKSDAIGRVPPARKSTTHPVRWCARSIWAYSADHNSVTVTDGSGRQRHQSHDLTDNDGHTVLSIAYPVRVG